MRPWTWTCLLVAATVLAGCRTSSQAYVDENSGGYFIVKGRISQLSSMSSTVWQPLSDGLAFRLSDAGCTVALDQELSSGSTKRTQFELTAGDHVVLAGEFDYILSSVQQQQSQGGPGTPVPDKQE